MGKRKIKVNLSTLMQNVLEERPTTFNDLIDIHKQFVEDKKLEGISDRTIEDYYSSMKYFKKFLDFEYRTEVERLAINSRVLKNYVSYMLNDKGYAPCTVNIRIKNLKTFFRWGYNNNHISHDIALHIKTVKAPLDTVEPLDERTIKKLLNTCDLSTYAGFRDFCAIVLVLDCGIRGNELVQLVNDDIDFAKKLIRIRADVSKTRTERFLPISSKTSKLLKELVHIGTFNGLDNYVFQSTYGGSISSDNLNISLRRVKDNAGIENKRVTLYVLRHTFATNSIKAGMDVFTLQRIMGHQVLQTTRRYIQLDTSDLQAKHKQYSRIDNYLTRGGMSNE